MPIYAEELNLLLWELDRELSGCAHTLVQTERAIDHLHLSHQKEKIISWLNQAGGYCDCEVLLNVPSKYGFLIEDLDDSYLMTDSEEEPLALDLHTALQLWAVRATKLHRLEQWGGFKLTSIPKPWKLFSYQDTLFNFKILCYGKGTGVGNKFCAYLFHMALPIKDDDQHLIQAWREINASVVKNGQVGLDFLISRSVILIGQRPVQQLMIENVNASTKTLWIFDPANPSWHMLIAHSPLQIKSELFQFYALIKQAMYEPEAPLSPTLKNEHIQTKWQPSQETHQKTEMLSSFKEFIKGIFSEKK